MESRDVRTKTSRYLPNVVDMKAHSITIQPRFLHPLVRYSHLENGRAVDLNRIRSGTTLM